MLAYAPVDQLDVELGVILERLAGRITLLPREKAPQLERGVRARLADVDNDQVVVGGEMGLSAWFQKQPASAAGIFPSPTRGKDYY